MKDNAYNYKTLSMLILFKLSEFSLSFFSFLALIAFVIELSSYPGLDSAEKNEASWIFAQEEQVIALNKSTKLTQTSKAFWWRILNKYSLLHLDVLSAFSRR